MQLEERIHALKDVAAASGEKVHTAADQIAAELNVGKVAVTGDCKHCGKCFLIEHYMLRNHEAQCAKGRSPERHTAGAAPEEAAMEEEVAEALPSVGLMDVSYQLSLQARREEAEAEEHKVKSRLRAAAGQYNATREARARLKVWIPPLYVTYACSIRV
jgi:hypothetical protein